MFEFLIFASSVYLGESVLAKTSSQPRLLRASFGLFIHREMEVDSRDLHFNFNEL